MTFSIDGVELDQEDVRRFAAKVDVQPNGCWLWVGAAGAYRTGTFSWVGANGKLIQGPVKRFAWAAAHGGIGRGQQVRNICGNPLCCNPKHLVLVGDVAGAAGGADLVTKQVEDFNTVLDVLNKV